jgi:hypothetical protein
MAMSAAISGERFAGSSPSEAVALELFDLDLPRLAVKRANGAPLEFGHCCDTSHLESKLCRVYV